jgi:hypothetical protein
MMQSIVAQAVRRNRYRVDISERTTRRSEGDWPRVSANLLVPPPLAEIARCGSEPFRSSMISITMFDTRLE